MSIRVCSHCGRITGVRECPWCGRDTVSGVEVKHRLTTRKRVAPVSVQDLAGRYGLRAKVVRRWLRRFANEQVPNATQPVQQLSYEAKTAKVSLIGRIKTALRSLLPRRLQHAA